MDYNSTNRGTNLSLTVLTVTNCVLVRDVTIFLKTFFYFFTDDVRVVVLIMFFAC